MAVVPLFAIAALGYFVGSVPTGYLVAKAKGIDIRSVGSGNIGATNAFRVLGKGPGTLVLLIDALKGFAAATFLVWHGADPLYCHLVGGFAAILGHNYTCWLRFKGGKGIATSAGVMLAWLPLALLIVLSTWLVILWVTRYVSLASILAAMMLPVSAYITRGGPEKTALCVVMGSLAIYKHRANIQRLRAGTENRIGQSKKDKINAKPGVS